MLLSGSAVIKLGFCDLMWLSATLMWFVVVIAAVECPDGVEEEQEQETSQGPAPSGGASAAAGGRRNPPGGKSSLILGWDYTPLNFVVFVSFPNAFLFFKKNSLLQSLPSHQHLTVSFFLCTRAVTSMDSHVLSLHPQTLFVWSLFY